MPKIELSELTPKGCGREGHYEVDLGTRSNLNQRFRLAIEEKDNNLKICEFTLIDALQAYVERTQCCSFLSLEDFIEEIGL